MPLMCATEIPVKGAMPRVVRLMAHVETLKRMIDGGMVSISSVKVTPDLLEARFYLSFFQVKDVKAALQKIEDRHHEIKKELAAKVRHQLRSIPVLKFFQDDTLDQVFKMEEIFKKIEEDKNKEK